MKQWYALVVPPQREFAAVEVLRAHHVDAFAPTEYRYTRQNRYSKKKQARPFPMLARYVFAGCEGEMPWYKIRTLDFPNSNQRVITSVLSMQDRPTPLPGSEVLHLMAVAEMQAPTKIPISRGFKVGEMVQIIDGPLSGHVVKVARIEKQATILIEILSSMREVDVPLEMIEAA